VTGKKKRARDPLLLFLESIFPFFFVASSGGGDIKRGCVRTSLFLFFFFFSCFSRESIEAISGQVYFLFLLSFVFPKTRVTVQRRSYVEWMVVAPQEIATAVPPPSPLYDLFFFFFSFFLHLTGDPLL